MKMSVLAVLLVAGTMQVAGAETAAYEVNKDHTDVGFRIGHAGFTQKHGEFTDISGVLMLDPDHMEASSVDITIRVDSILTNHTKRDQVLQSPDFLDGAGFPTLRFVSTHVTRTAPDMLDVAGTLTLHGVSKPLVLHAKINRIGISPFGKVPAAGFTATGSLKRSDFGITTMIPLIGDEVQIDIDAEFKGRAASE